MAPTGQSTAQILPEVYQELRNLARSRLNARGPVSLQPTQLVHEVYLKLEGRGWEWINRAHFFSAAAEAMRRVLLDHARQKGTEKRGGERRRVTLSGLADVAALDADVLSLDAALAELERLDSIMADLVKLRFLCGLSMAEAAEVLGLSKRTAARHWESARVWLYQRLSSDDVC